MSDLQWETLSNQAIAAAGIVYFLALLSHLVEWSALRTVPVGRAARVAVPAGVGSTTDESGSDAGADAPDAAKRYRIDMFGRLGLLLTVIACGAHFVGLVGRGMAADPNRESSALGWAVGIVAYWQRCDLEPEGLPPARVT